MTPNVMSPEMTKTIEALCNRLTRRVSWARAMKDDLRQEAWLAVQQASATFDPSVGVSFEGYAQRAAMFRLMKVLWRDSLPVRARFLQDPEARSAVRRSCLPVALAGEHEEEGMDLAAEVPVPEAQLADLEWEARVNREVRALLGEGPEAEMAAAVLLGGVSSESVATLWGVDVKLVYYYTQRARRRIARDAALYQLFQELN